MGLSFAVGRDVSVVFLDGGGEAAVTGGVADEVDVVGGCGRQSGEEGGHAGVADGSGGEAGVPVGVVGGVELKIGGVDGSAVSAGEECGVDDGGVSLEGHVFTEAVAKDAGDDWTFGGLGDLFFNKGGHGDDGLPVDAGGGLFGGEIGRPGGSLWLELAGCALPAPDHGAEHRLRRGVRAEAIGVGKEEALEGAGAGADGLDQIGMDVFGCEKGVAGAEAGLLDGLCDIEDVVSGRDDEGPSVDIAAGDAGVDLEHGGGVVEAVLAGAEATAFEEAKEIEGVSSADDAVLFKQGADAGGTGSRRDVDEGLGPGTVGEEKGVHREGDQQESKDSKQPEGLQRHPTPRSGRGSSFYGGRRRSRVFVE